MQGHNFRDVGLNEDDATLRIDAGGQPIQDHVLDIRLDLGRFIGGFDGGQGVNIDGAIDTIVLLLELYTVLQRPHVVAEMEQTRGTHSRKDDALFTLGRFLTYNHNL